MPNLDKTGPEGKGPRTGNENGNCGSRKNLNNGRRGFGRGKGNGQGHGNAQGRGKGRGYGAQNGRRLGRNRQ